MLLSFNTLDSIKHSKCVKILNILNCPENVKVYFRPIIQCINCLELVYSSSVYLISKFLWLQTSLFFKKITFTISGKGMLKVHDNGMIT